MMRITIDTNVLICGIDGSLEEQKVFDDLMSLKQRELLDIAITSRFDQDKKKDSDLERVKKHYQIARMLTAIPSSFRCGISLLGQDRLVDEVVYKPLSKLFKVEDSEKANHNTLMDVDHLYGHWVDNREYFLTYENRILRKKEALVKLNIKVDNPSNFLISNNLW